MLSAYFNIKHFFPDAQIRVDLTRKGYHVRAFIPEVKQKHELSVRAAFGDDKVRILLDESRCNLLTRSVLWSEKKGFKAQKDINPLGDNSPFQFNQNMI